MAERSEAKSAKRSFASKIAILGILTRSFASRFLSSFYISFRAPRWHNSMKVKFPELILKSKKSHFRIGAKSILFSRNLSWPQTSQARKFHSRRSSSVCFSPVWEKTTFVLAKNNYTFTKNRSTRSNSRGMRLWHLGWWLFLTKIRRRVSHVAQITNSFMFSGEF